MSSLDNGITGFVCIFATVAGMNPVTRVTRVTRVLPVYSVFAACFTIRFLYVYLVVFSHLACVLKCD